MSESRTVVVTGAGSGIGKATAELFYERGANVVLIGRTRSKLEDTAADWSKERCLILACDVSQEDEVKEACRQIIDSFSRVDALINNAAVASMGNIDELDSNGFKKMQDINVLGTFLMIQNLMPHLKKTKGSIVNLSSVSGIGGDWGAFGYNTSKGAVTNMTKALALDYKKNKVRVNAVAPSLTDTDMGEGVIQNEDLYGKFKERIPIGRAAKPEEVAKAIAFLASDDAVFVNGVILPVDGGLSASCGQPPLNN